MTSADPTGHIAFITGGASGIGRAVAALLQRRGMKLALMDPIEPALQAAAAQLGGGEVLTVAGDVTRPEDCQRAVALAVQRFGGIDLCWANASIGALAPLRQCRCARVDVPHAGQCVRRSTRCRRRCRT